ncbi:hypothetical protein FACS1894166_13300 [Bacilli bacterium]|nr:hypothetical protein FACS1894166_13300 [Bacilli bacterium]
MALNKMILGNWKMNKTFEEIETFCHEFNKLIKSDKILRKSGTTIGIAPTFMGIPPFASNINPDIKVMAQNCSAKDSGAYTSEVSYRMLKELNVNYVLLGHSEVRAHLNENDQSINEKVKTLLNHGMHAILCIGETLKEFETKKTKVILTKQLQADLAGADLAKLEYLTIAYEPI